MKRRFVISADSWQSEDSIARSVANLQPTLYLFCNAGQAGFINLEQPPALGQQGQLRPNRNDEKRLDFCLRQF